MEGAAGARKPVTILDFMKPEDAKTFKKTSLERIEEIPEKDRILVAVYNILFPQRIPPDPKFNNPIGYSFDPQIGLYDNIAFRMTIIIKNIVRAKPDILCLQEVAPVSIAALQNSAPLTNLRYKIIYEFHTPNTHGVAILYREEKFKLLQRASFTFQLCVIDQNDKTKVKNKKREHLVVDFSDNQTKIIYRVACCHIFSPLDLGCNRELHTQKILEDVTKMPQIKPIDRVLFCADSNQDQFGDEGELAEGQEPSMFLASSFKPLKAENYHIYETIEPDEYVKENFDNGPVSLNKRMTMVILSKQHQVRLKPVEGFDPRGSDHKLKQVEVL